MALDPELTKVTSKNWFVVAVAALALLAGGVVQSWIPLLGPLLVPALLLPVGLYVYVHLHEHLHVGKARRPEAFDAWGIALSLPLGTSWKIYIGHHTNHHQHNNGVRDFSCTTDAAGAPLPGLAYLKRTALVPWALQLVPFWSVVKMKPAHRTAAAWVDEGARVALRVLVLKVFGLSALVYLLAWQLWFLAFLMYVNYLQHFEAPVGSGVVWGDVLFNTVFYNFGLHHQHHVKPSAASSGLPAMARGGVERSRIGLFDPRVIMAFVSSPEALRAVLS